MRSISRARTTFCWLPPERPPARVCGAAAANVVLLDQLRRALEQAAGEQPAEPSSRADGGSRGGRCSRRSRTRARARAAAGPPGCGRAPTLKWPRALSLRDVLAVHATPVPDADLAQARHRVDQLGLPVAVDPGDADDLARPDLEREAAHLLDPAVVEHVQVLDVEQRCPSGCDGPLSTRSSTSRPTISRARLSSVAPSAGSVSIFLPRRSTVIRSATSVTSFSLWLMKMIDLPCSVRPRMISNSSPRLLRRQHRRRLVEHEDVGVAVERLQDLDPLLLPDRDVLDASPSGRRRARTAPRSRAPGRSPRRGRGTRRRASARPRARCSPPPSSPGSA